ncbi:MAG: methyltransferase domain-containing protein [Pseudomonas sp.]|uniref:class I SAM-dependent methyltransferase n=1 Tax=Pseudomonas sp. TaxID=306 RepID=UPI003396F61A
MRISYRVPRNQFALVNEGARLKPVGYVSTRSSFASLFHGAALTASRALAQALLPTLDVETFSIRGFCAPCGLMVNFRVDRKAGGELQDRHWLPNWRERLECPACAMNNRQRLIATLLMQALGGRPMRHVYLMEQVTPIYRWAKRALVAHRLYGSEYLGHEYPSGTSVQGLRHEDVQQLSFATATLDLIVSNDVLEHVPHPRQAFAECARVLKPGGSLLATIPFHANSETTVCRAQLIDGNLLHRLPPAFHGNPVSEKGSLVFSDFGWDILEQMKSAGFTDAYLELYAAERLGHLGSGELVFRAIK